MATAEKPVLARYKERMDKTVAALKDEFTTLRTGRATAGLLDQVMVEAYGATTPITAVASISVPDPRSITVSVWDRGVVVSVEKAIRNSGLGFNPVVEGQTLRVPIPPLTEERRRELVKRVLGEGEHAKVAIRSIRRECIEQVKKLQKDGLSEDIAKDGEAHIQGITDKFIALVDQHCKDKEKEIMTV